MGRGGCLEWGRRVMVVMVMRRMKRRGGFGLVVWFGAVGGIGEESWCGLEKSIHLIISYLPTYL